MAGSSAIRLDVGPIARAEPGPGTGLTLPGRGPTPPGPIGPDAGPPRRTWLGRLLALGLELVVAAGISFGFFALFLVNLAIVFPSALSLQSLASELQSRPEEEGRAPERAPVRRTLTAAVPIATLTILHPTVRTKPADAITWSPAESGRQLIARDGVQTGAEGSARLEFGSGGELDLGPNSLVILSPGAHGKERGGRARAVVVLEGEIWARFKDGEAAPQLTVGVSVLGVRGGAESGALSEFRVRVVKNEGSTISVLQGSVEIETPSGRVSIGAGESSRVAANGRVTPMKFLPPRPQPQRPANRANFRYRKLSPQIEFRWAEIPRAARYRLVVIRDDASREVVLDEKVAWPSLTWSRLGVGSYCWRVSAFYGELEGEPSAWRTFSLVLEPGHSGAE
jgi:hypothetical protein